MLKIAMTKTCENLALTYKQLHLLCPQDLWNLPGTALLSGFQSSQGALRSTEQDNTQ